METIEDNVLRFSATRLAASEERNSVIALRTGAHDAMGGSPSTVLDLTGPEPKILREGAIGVSALLQVLAGFR